MLECDGTVFSETTNHVIQLASGSRLTTEVATTPDALQTCDVAQTSDAEATTDDVTTTAVKSTTDVDTTSALALTTLPPTDDVTSTAVKPTTDEMTTSALAVTTLPPSDDVTSAAVNPTTDVITTPAPAVTTPLTLIDCGTLGSFVEPPFQGIEEGAFLKITNLAPFTVDLFRMKRPGKALEIWEVLAPGEFYSATETRSKGLWLAVDVDDKIISIGGSCYVTMEAPNKPARYEIP